MKLLAAIQLLLPGMPFIYYGDEVGMTGGPDPDCRRGMLWEEHRQDREILTYYRRLIALRKQYPQLIEGDPDQIFADDETGLVSITRGNLTVVFHGKEGRISLPEYEGSGELIRNMNFDGTLGSFEAALIIK